MDGGEGSVQTLLASSLAALTKAVQATEKRTREDFEVAELEYFLMYKNDDNHGILKLGAVVPAYADCMKAMGVATRVEVEQLWNKHYQEPKVKEAVKNLLKAEKNFTELVDEIEAKMSPSEDKLTINHASPPVAQQFPDLNSLIEIPSGQPVSLETYYKKAKFTLFVFLRLLG